MFDAVKYTEARAGKDAAFSDTESSPLPDDRVASFKGLHYYAPSKEYVVSAKLHVYEAPETLQLATTKDDLRDATRYGSLKFTLNGDDLELQVYRFANASHSYLFLPFKDATTGDETYGTGRYLDLEMQDGEEYEIDFNKAYSPLCAYNDKYSCPLVPAENTLKVAVKAGEKSYH